MLVFAWPIGSRLREGELSMNNVAKRCVALAAGAVALSATAVWAAQPNEQELQKEINELKGQVAQLQAQQGQDQSAVAATIEQVLRDAEKRSALMAAGDSGAGYDNGFYIRSGDFYLKPGITFQFRNVTDYRQNTGGNKDDEVENGFEVRRMQLKLEGTAFSKDLSYTLIWNTDRDTGSLFAEDLFIHYRFSGDWGVRAGMWKEPFFHEKITSDAALLPVERSLLDATLGGGWDDRVEGVALTYGGGSGWATFAQLNDKDPLHLELAFTDGSNTDNTNYVGHYPGDPAALDQVKGPGPHNFDFGMDARVEYKVMGNWKNYSDFSALGTKERMLILGGAIQWNQGGDGDEIAGTVDAAFEDPSGLGIYGALVVRHIDGSLSALAAGQTDWGGQIMVSYLFQNQWEPFVRYSYVGYDSDVASAGSKNDFHEISTGVAYYFGQNGSAGHRCEMTVDLNWLPNGSPTKLTGQGYLGDSNGNDEIVLRAQFQLTL
jgi:hypothetical protein